MSWTGIPFEKRISGFDERAVHETDPVKLVAMLAFGKAMSVRDRLYVEYGGNKEIVIIGADTMAFLEDEHGAKTLIGKPDDMDHAREILKNFRGREHFIYTGVAVVDMVSREKQIEVDVSRVVFKKFSDDELEKYLETGEWAGKAGAYMLLGKADTLIEKVEGSVTGVVGLPLARTLAMLKKVGVTTNVDVSTMLLKRIGSRD